MRRRQFLAVGAAALLPRVARAETPRPNGRFAFSCTPAGLAGLVLEGEDGAVLDPTWAWHLGSNTKAMTAALYARLVDRGRCRWGATLPQLFPALGVHPAWAGTTVEQLMGHVAGLTDAPVTPAWLMERHTDRSSPRAQRQALVAALLAAPPAGTPGAYVYGNLNFVVVGAAIEAATGLSWEEAIAAELFAPLGIRDAGVGAPRRGLWGRAGPTLIPIDPAGFADNPAVLAPAGGVHMPPASYARFLQLFLDGGRPLLRSETLAWLLAPPIAGARYAGGWALEGGTLTHDGSNTLWYVSAQIDRAARRAYAAGINRGGAEGARIAHEGIARLKNATSSQLKLGSGAAGAHFDGEKPQRSLG
ncbi:Beta-lactamase [Sphingomonas guangdongensis]|uniref:Beta-lactamase n=1 Tax=Sphingomonas guangdongensis TaxID=1141890 RepID=A0A285QE83_9SPHN|nr:serine hydrolase domain-containing protein [Sphingomonas guangdongensis]SOB79828.1 Beta-lactamase [Sphingomonas guangdongensis]